MKKRFILLLSMVLILCSGSLWADFYQWVDKDGVKHFTDNVLEVPEAQRPQVKIHKTVDEAPPPTAQDTATAAETADDAETNKDDDTRASLQTERAQLKKEQAELQKEQAELQKKREELTSQRDKMRYEDYKSEHNKLNVEIVAYEKKRLDYEKRVKAFNDRITGRATENNADSDTQKNQE